MQTYVRPEAKVILFDNSDIITASKGKLGNGKIYCPSNEGDVYQGWVDNCSLAEAGQFCTVNGDNSLPNGCTVGGWTVCELSLGTDEACLGRIGMHFEKCDLSGNHNFGNSNLDDPISFDDEEDNW